jgi:Kef-type K+ transport system membrane component KefB
VTLAAWGFPLKTSMFAAALCLATSPAITIATTSDVGAKGDNTGLLLTLVAINGSLAFIGVTWATSALVQSQGYFSGDVLVAVIQKLARSVALGAGCAAVVLRGAKRLGRQSDHQHLLIIGSIVFGVGMALSLDLSVFLPMLIFGYLTKTFDRHNSVVAIRIASDARIFLVVTFVLAGAALDIGLVPRYWPVAVSIILARFAAQFLTLRTCRNALGMTPRTAGFTAIGLQPMSSVALVLLSSTQSLYGTLEADLAGSLMATILLLQLVGPLATQTAILGFGEATLLNGTRFRKDSSTPESA